MSRGPRTTRYGHAGAVVWMTGLSGAGKTTLSTRAGEALTARGYLVYVLDGDELRRGLNADLGFSEADRRENIRRAGEVAALFADAGLLVFAAFISPYAADRERARAAAGGRFHEVYLAADMAACERRDPRGLYRRARAGEIPSFTGLTAPYEAPEAPDLRLDTGSLSIDDSVSQLVDYVTRHVPIVKVAS